MKSIPWPIVALVIGIVFGVLGERARYTPHDSLVVFHDSLRMHHQKAFDGGLFVIVQGELEGHFAELAGARQARLYHPIITPSIGGGFEYYVFAVPGAQPLDDSLNKALQDFVLARLEHYTTEESAKAQAGK